MKVMRERHVGATLNLRARYQGATIKTVSVVSRAALRAILVNVGVVSAHGFARSCSKPEQKKQR